MTFLRRRIRDFWDGKPPDYSPDASFDILDARRDTLYPYMRTLVTSRATRDGPVLEIGPGAGFDACAYLGAAPTSLYVLLDVAPGNLKVARAHLLAHRASAPFEAVAATAEALPFRTRQFEQTIAYGVLHHLANQEAAFREVGRVARGTVLLMVYHSRSFRRLLLQLQAWRQRRRLHDLVRSIEGAGNPMTRLYSVDLAREICASAGIRIENIRLKELGRRTQRMLSRLFGRPLADLVERYWGWSLILEGRIDDAQTRSP